jgi:hypothetical protein
MSIHGARAKPTENEVGYVSLSHLMFIRLKSDGYSVVCVCNVFVFLQRPG